MYLLAPRDLDQPLWVAILFVVFALAGGGIGALSVLQSVMIADAVDYEEYHKGYRPDGVFFSGQSLLPSCPPGSAPLFRASATPSWALAATM